MKKKHKPKIAKEEVDTYLQQITHKLPTCALVNERGIPLTVMTVSQGDCIIEAGDAIRKDEDFGNIDPNARYQLSNTLMLLDHYKNLQKAWKKGADAAVEKYIRKVHLDYQRWKQWEQLPPEVKAQYIDAQSKKIQETEERRGQQIVRGFRIPPNHRNKG